MFNAIPQEEEPGLPGKGLEQCATEPAALAVPENKEVLKKKQIVMGVSTDTEPPDSNRESSSGL